MFCSTQKHMPNLIIHATPNQICSSGVTAVLTPKITPHFKTVIQHSPRILELILRSCSGDIHLIGVYAPHDKSDEEVRHGADPVVNSEEAKYLGSQISWLHPSSVAIEARKAKAHIAYFKLQYAWRSRLNIKTKIKLFMASIVPVLLYGLEVTTLENKHLKTIDACFHRYIRRCIRVKASYYSLVTNERVWKVSGRLTLPSRTLLTTQFQQLTDILAKPPAHPLHHVFFSPGYKDSIKFTKSRHRGHPNRYWLELTVERALPIYHHYLDHTAP